MKSFLGINKKPIIKWGLLPNNTFYEGVIPEGYNLFISPGDNYIVLDVDVSDKINGFHNIPKEIYNELMYTFFYATKRMGCHYWLKYSGDKILANKTSGLSIDLRVGDKGYVVYYPKDDIRNNLHLIKETSKELNLWIEKLFSYK